MEFFQKILDFDTELFLFLNSFHSEFWDTVMIMVSRKEIWIPFFITILFFSIKNFRSKWWLVVLFIAVNILVADQLSVLMKETIQRLRPSHNPEIEHLVHNVFKKGGMFGFVSSHAANSFAIFALTTRLFRNRGYWLLMLFWALLFSYSRIYTGVHYPLDIVGGAALGWLVGVACYKILIFLEVHFFLAVSPKLQSVRLLPRQSGLVFLVFCVVAATVLLMTYFLHKYSFL